jgi:hypothetical protein
VAPGVAPAEQVPWGLGPSATWSPRAPCTELRERRSSGVQEPSVPELPENRSAGSSFNLIFRCILKISPCEIKELDVIFRDLQAVP